MKSITIHNLDNKLYTSLKEKALKEGKSINQVAKGILRLSFGLESEVSIDNKDSFSEFFGAWSKKDFQEFKNATKDLRRIDKVDWEE